MRKIVTALTIATLSLGAAEAIAKGNGGAEQREALRAELAKSRAQNDSAGSSGGFFSFIFGEDEEKAEGKNKKISN
ncbi:MAG: hypothetical protein AAGE80_03380 [Pseudomonadota bacterium]